MHARHLLSLTAAQAAFAQSLTDVLGAQNGTLSTLIGLLEQQPQVVNALNGLQNITILAPSTAAFDKVLSDPAVASAVQSQPGLVAALLSYHVLNGTYYASDLTEATDALFISTLLTDPAYSTVSGGQRVEIRSENNNVVVYSGNDAQATVQATDFNFTGGTLHVIDNVLAIPPGLIDALLFNNLTALAGAVGRANLAQPLSDVAELTLFAPSDEAFAAVKDVAAGLTIEQLTAVLRYHVIEGAVLYSVDVEDGTATTLEGTDVTLSVRDDGIFVNDAKVVQPDILVKNGVVHVIDRVLIPQDLPGSSNATITGTGTGTLPSRTPVPTTTATFVPGAAASMGGGVVGVAALFGGAAALMNM